jgi:hypothetical protein
MEMNPLDARYIAKMKPVCHDCGARATWGVILDVETQQYMEFCTEHVPVAPHHITDASPA